MRFDVASGARVNPAPPTASAHLPWFGTIRKPAPHGPAVPADVAADADRVKSVIIAGELHPFTGPIGNQAGELVLPEGSA